MTTVQHYTAMTAKQLAMSYWHTLLQTLQTNPAFSL